MPEQPKETKVNIEKTINLNPTKTVSRSNNFGTIVADHAIVTLSEDTQLCTFTFFQTHAIPKIDERGIIVDSIEEEMVIEVKMPFSTAFAVSMYMNAMLKQFQSYQGKPHPTGTFFGPTAVRNTPKPQETTNP
jgi:hypothetical protein